MTEKKEPERCEICSRELTNPQSIKRGIGPVCFEREHDTTPCGRRLKQAKVQMTIPIEFD